MATRNTCHKCEGSGRVYGDGRAHYYGENIPTKDCPKCEGTGGVCSECEAPVSYETYLETDECPSCGTEWKEDDNV